ncbi:MurR/RpiR family transcriptional regulator [Lactovum odontotermitis]
MNALLLISEKYAEYSPVEKKIADFILKQEGQILEMSAQELARRTGTSPAALVRFSRTLGFSGFPQLKQQLSAALASMDHASDYEEVSRNETVASIKSKVRARMINMVEQTNCLLTDKSVKAASKLIDKSQAVFVYGIGASSLVAQDIYQKLTRIGKAVFFTQDLHHIAATLVSLKENSSFIAISNSGETKEVIRLAKIAQKNNIPVIGLTGRENSSLGEICEVVLNSVSGEAFTLRTAATMSLMAQLYVVDILFYDYLSQHFDESLDGIQATRETIKFLEEKK